MGGDLFYLTVTFGELSPEVAYFTLKLGEQCLQLHSHQEQLWKEGLLPLLSSDQGRLCRGAAGQSTCHPELPEARRAACQAFLRCADESSGLCAHTAGMFPLCLQASVFISLSSRDRPPKLRLDLLCGGEAAVDQTPDLPASPSSGHRAQLAA